MVARCMDCKAQIRATVMQFMDKRFKMIEGYDSLDWKRRNELLFKVWERLEPAFFTFEGPITKDDIEERVNFDSYLELFSREFDLKIKNEDKA